MTIEDDDSGPMTGSQATQLIEIMMFLHFGWGKKGFKNFIANQEQLEAYQSSFENFWPTYKEAWKESFPDISDDEMEGCKASVWAGEIADHYVDFVDAELARYHANVVRVEDCPACKEFQGGADAIA